jgi:hypothetical protein
MVFAFRTVNGWAAKFLLLLRRDVSATGPCAAVLFHLRRKSFGLLSSASARESQCNRVSASSALTTGE